MKPSPLPSAVAASLFLSLAGNPAAGQTPGEEIARVRHMLELPESATISVAVAPRLPTVTPIKLFIATGLEIGLRQNFVKWVEEWNRTDAKKHGPVVLVNNAVSADAIIVTMVDREKAKIATGTGLRTGVVADPLSGTLHAVPYTDGYSYSVVPVFAYLLSQPSSLGPLTVAAREVSPHNFARVCRRYSSEHASVNPSRRRRGCSVLGSPYPRLQRKFDFTWPSEKNS